MENNPQGIRSGPFITIDEASCCETIPEVPVYRPTEAEFRDFATCMVRIEEMGAQHMGLVKIIPPPSWCPRRGGYQDVDFTVENPIIQVSSGTHGIYLQDVRVQKSMSFKKYEKISNSPKHRTPSHSSIDELEDIYWKTISSMQPLYGANLSGSLTDEDLSSCNIPRLQSILSDVLAEEDIEISGINTPYLYVGAWGTTFAWHVEDVELYSINYMHFGAPKLWYTIPPAFARKFEAFARGKVNNEFCEWFLLEHFKSEFLACRSFIRHKSILIHPKILAKAGIPTRRVLQHPGEIMCTFPYGYHAGFNLGVNCAESTNFALERWVEYGKQACICHCWENTVRLDMEPFVRRFQPQNYEAWKRGETTAPHPLDAYKPRMTIENGHSEVSEKFPPQPDCFKDMTNAVDLNVRSLFYSSKELAEAKWPLYLRHNVKLQHLWCGEEMDFKSIIHFNQLIGSEDPFCSICAYFWSPPNTRKALCNRQSDDHKERILESSEPYLSEVVFCQSPNDFASIRTRLNPSSLILFCARCKVAVHACCYGIDENDLVDDDASQSERRTWWCDACVAAMADRVSNEPQCVLCPMRGGALKALANPRNSKRAEQFWIHLGCAIAVGPQYCPFIDVPRRKPLLVRPSFSSSLKKDERSSRSSMSGRSSIKSGAVSKPRGACQSQRRDSLTVSLCGDEIDDSIDLTGFEEDLEHGSPVNFTRASKRHKSSLSDSSRSPAAEIQNKRTGTPRKRCSRPPFWANSDDYVVEAPQKPSKSSDKKKSESPSLEVEELRRRDHCDECGLASPGGPNLNLPLVSCWHEDCSTKLHLTCAQFGGVLIATSQYPYCFYLTCQRHLNEYREFDHDEELPPLSPGDMVYALSSENGRYYKAIAMNPVGPRLCKLAFSDGTYSKDTPSDCILNHDWSLGEPVIGSKVKVVWTDGGEYTAVFQGASEEKWEVHFPNGQIHKVRRGKIFRLKERIPPHIMKLVAHQ